MTNCIKKVKEYTICIKSVISVGDLRILSFVLTINVLCDQCKKIYTEDMIAMIAVRIINSAPI